MGQAPSESWPRVPGGLIWAPRRWVNQKRFQMIGSKVFETNAIENTDSRLYIYKRRHQPQPLDVIYMSFKNTIHISRCFFSNSASGWFHDFHLQFFRNTHIFRRLGSPSQHLLRDIVIRPLRRCQSFLWTRIGRGRISDNFCQFPDPQFVHQMEILFH